jgi:hydrogenase large subunit
MLPGGVTVPLDRLRILECMSILGGYTRWYERAVLGCSLDRWLAIETSDDFWFIRDSGRSS